MPEIPDDVVQAAADVIAAELRALMGDRRVTPVRDSQARAILSALAGAGRVVVPTELLHALTDPDECWFDHHGGCQAHGFLSLEPGERCPQAEAREILAALPERTDHG